MNSRVPDIAIDIHDLRVDAGGRCLLHLPALRVHHGERVALVGPNGAGKSTLLKALGGLMPITRGRITVLGRTFAAPGPSQATAALSAEEWRRLRAEVGQVMQGLHLVPRLSAADNVVLGALGRPDAMPRWRSWLRLYPPALRREAEVALADLGLSDRQHTRADQLSGGERQKASLARLRLQRPRLILADEPTAALDPNATQQACAALLAAADQATLLTVVHQPALMHQLADRVLGLSDGQIVFDLPTAQVSPATLERLYATSAVFPDPLNGPP